MRIQGHDGTWSKIIYVKHKFNHKILIIMEKHGVDNFEISLNICELFKGQFLQIFQKIVVQDEQTSETYYNCYFFDFKLFFHKKISLSVNKKSIFTSN